MLQISVDFNNKPLAHPEHLGCSVLFCFILSFGGIKGILGSQLASTIEDLILMILKGQKSFEYFFRKVLVTSYVL